MIATINSLPWGAQVIVWFCYFELSMPDLLSVLVQCQTVLLAVKQIHLVVSLDLFFHRGNTLTR